jgi:putative transcriptional regulator
MRTQKRKKTGVSRKKSSAKSTILESVYEAAKDMHDIGLMDTVTMHEFESICKHQVQELGPTKIKQIRFKEKVSQPIFAWYLNVQPTTVKKWETGENTPSGPALRLLNVVQAHGLEYIVQ